jgi:hypothetical protein
MTIIAIGQRGSLDAVTLNHDPWTRSPEPETLNPGP